MRLLVTALLALVATSGSAQVPVALPADTTALWRAEGPSGADTVIVYVQGGPSSILGFGGGHSTLRRAPGYGRFRAIYLHQAQTVQPNLFRSYLSENGADSAVATTVDILRRAITYHQVREQTVIVIGFSYGAFVTQRQLALGAPYADRYIILAGRIAMSPAMSAETAEGYLGTFADDGVTYEPANREAVASHSPEQARVRLSRNRLIHAVSVPTSLSELGDADLSSVTYLYAANDTNVGRLTAEEIAFLEARGAEVTVRETSHGGILWQFVDGLRTGAIKL